MLFVNLAQYLLSLLGESYYLESNFYSSYLLYANAVILHSVIMKVLHG